MNQALLPETAPVITGPDGAPRCHEGLSVNHCVVLSNVSVYGNDCTCTTGNTSKTNEKLDGSTADVAFGCTCTVMSCWPAVVNTK